MGQEGERLTGFAETYGLTPRKLFQDTFVELLKI